MKFCVTKLKIVARKLQFELLG